MRQLVEPQEKLFLTPAEAGELLQLHPATVRRMALAGELRYERSGPGKMSHIRIVAKDVYERAGQALPRHDEVDVEGDERRRIIRAVRVKMAEVAMLLAELEA